MAKLSVRRTLREGQVCSKKKNARKCIHDNGVVKVCLNWGLSLQMGPFASHRNNNLKNITIRQLHMKIFELQIVI